MTALLKPFKRCSKDELHSEVKEAKKVVKLITGCVISLTTLSPHETSAGLRWQSRFTVIVRIQQSQCGAQLSSCMVCKACIGYCKASICTNQMDTMARILSIVNCRYSLCWHLTAMRTAEAETLNSTSSCSPSGTVESLLATKIISSLPWKDLCSCTISMHE